MHADLILEAQTILTMDPACPRAESLAIRDGKIIELGRREQIAERCGAAAERVDLGPATLLPAFIDAHHHYSLAALDRRAPDLHVTAGTTIQALLERLSAHLRATPGAPGEWLRAQGYSVQKLAEGRAPRREELDEICPDRPLLLLAYSCHEGVLNSAGLERMGYTAAMPDPPGGMLPRRSGELTGELIESPFFAAEAFSRGQLLENGAEQWIAECAAHGRDLLAAGIVRVGDAAVPPSFDALYMRAEAAGMLPVKVHRMPIGESSFIAARTDGEATGAGPRQAPRGAAKIFLDGADNCALCASPIALLRSLAETIAGLRHGGMAALRAGARMRSGWRIDRHLLLHHGYSFWQQEQLSQAVRNAGANGLQVAQHAIGNEAIASALRALAEAGDALSGLPGSPRLEHAMLLDESLARQISERGVIAVVNPHFIADVGDELRLMSLPGELMAMPLRSMHAAGVRLAGGSDYPVSSYDVLAAIRAGATRRTAAGALLEPEQALAVPELLAAYTSGAAAALGVADEAGMLAPGYCADLVALSADPIGCQAAELDRLRILRTYRDGQLVHQS